MQYVQLCSTNDVNSVNGLANVDKSPNKKTPLKQTYPSNINDQINATLRDGANNKSLQCVNNISLSTGLSSKYVYLTHVGGQRTWRDAIGYFWWNSLLSPSKISDIPSSLIVLPWGLTGSTGPCLSPGDTFCLPYSGTITALNGISLLSNPTYTFPAGVNVGTFIIPNGWNLDGTLQTNIPPIFSLSVLNPNATRCCYLTTIIPPNGGIIFGYEDSASLSTCDYDYNDVILNTWMM